MATLLASNHNGPSGSALTAAYYGNALVTDGAGGTGQAQFASFHAHQGQSVRFDGTNGFRAFRYTAPSVWAKMAWRGYYEFESAPIANSQFLRVFNSTTNLTSISMAINSAGKILLRDGATTVWTSAVSMVGVPFRLDLRYNVVNAFFKCRLFYGVDLEAAVSAPTEESPDLVMTVNPTGGNVITWGWSVTTPNRFWLDDIQLEEDGVGFIGPTGGTPPGAAFSMSGTGGDVPLTIGFQDTSTGTPTSWSWNFGDGTPLDVTATPTHVYTVAGNYTVTLTATNAFGSSTASKSVAATTPVVNAGVPVKVYKNSTLNLRTGAQRKVRVAGVMQTITTINGITGVTDPPDPPPPTTLRFAGDPGVGKIYLGSNRPSTAAGGNGWEDTKVKWVRDRLSERTTTTSVPRTRKPRVLVSYLGRPAGDPPTDDGSLAWSYPQRPADQRKPSQRLVEYAHTYGAIPSIEVALSVVDLTGATPAKGDPTYDEFMDALADAYDAGLTGLTGNAATAITFLKNEVLAKLAPFAPDPIWLCFDHEVDTSDKIGPTQTIRQNKYRKAMRAIVLTIRREGYTHITVPHVTYTEQTLRGDSGRDWRKWHPDWKGTSTNGATAANAFPNKSTADFYTNDTKVGDLDESVVELLGFDVYYWNWEWVADATIANADLFDPTQWSGSMQATASMATIYKRLGAPIFMREMGTQAAGYLGSNGTLVQRTVDLDRMTELWTNLGQYVTSGAICALAYFNTYEHTWGVVDPTYSKAQGAAELADLYGVVPPIG